MRDIAAMAMLLSVVSGVAAAASTPEKSLTPKKSAATAPRTTANAPATPTQAAPTTTATAADPTSVPAPEKTPESAAAPPPAPKKSGAKSSSPLATVLDYGYYELEKEGDRYADPNIPSGEMIAGITVKRVELTNVIPLQKGRLFGFRFRISGLENHSAVEIREVVRHPRIVKPDKSKSTGYEVKLGLNVRLGEVTDYAGYRLDHDYEMVEGDWVFEFWLDDQKILEQKFTTVSQPPAPASASPAVAR